MENVYFAFLAPFGDLEAAHAVHNRLIGKPIVDFLNSHNWTIFTKYYGWGATSGYRWKSAFLKRRGQFDSNFQVEGSFPTKHFSS